MQGLWLDEGYKSTTFSQDIEKWLWANGPNLFRAALDGDRYSLEILPHWVALGIIDMRKEGLGKDAQ